MALSGPPAPPKPNTATSAANLWAIIDRRILNAITEAMNRLGKPRSRTMTISVPLASSSGPPPVGYLVSFGVANNIKIVAWEMCALVSGSITLDIKVSVIQPSPATAPTQTSLPGPSHLLSMTGFTTSNQDTSLWVSNQVSAGAIMHVFVTAATTIASAVLILRVIDMDSKVLQP